MDRKLNILILWRGIPNPYDASTSRIFYSLKHIMKYGHNIAWASYNRGGTENKFIDELKKYCNKIEIIDIPENKMGYKILHTFKDMLISPELVRNCFLPTNFYSRKMRNIIRNLLLGKKFDIIYCDRPMLPYVWETNLPKVLDIVDPVLYSRYQVYLKETRIFKKILWFLSYHHHKLFEVNKYKRFDSCIVVSSIHKELLKQYLPKNVCIIPYGVDLDYFNEVAAEEDTPSLVFVGWMSYFHNVAAICYFYNQIYPLIRERIRDIKLYIVGREPSKEVMKMAADKSVTVTGFVEDVRPYVSKASIAIVPIVTDDGGFKNKILEAMAMGKAVVTTTIGAKGIEVTPEQDILIADSPEEFASKVVELLNNKSLRREIGANARKHMEEAYCWEIMTDRLITVFKKVLDERKQ